MLLMPTNSVQHWIGQFVNTANMRFLTKTWIIGPSMLQPGTMLRTGPDFGPVPDISGLVFKTMG